MSNDSKYVRLYPERAVEPLRSLCERLVAMSEPRLASEMVGALEDLAQLGFPPDEPLFLLRGQDELAAEIVREYAHAIARNVNAFAGPGQHHRQVTIEHLRDHAEAMERWQPRKLPD